MIVVRTDVLRSILVQVSIYCSYLESSSCSGGLGHCKDDTGCQDPQFYSCREGTCLDTSVFPSHLYPNNSILLSATDSCCTRRCHPNFYICKVTGSSTLNIIKSIIFPVWRNWMWRRHRLWHWPLLQQNLGTNTGRFHKQFVSIRKIFAGFLWQHLLFIVHAKIWWCYMELFQGKLLQ